ncbi:MULTISPECIES: tRNA (guanosine(46)-N7)-methyltransferase TrmB [Zhenhengia]|jgi:tRNA (guanine-N7-)-methyltransferase|uniref:tRNA (guanosine(46)-N7)-methyltransferase TrmB n=1 Tax=Zhenhengia TaxID=2944196 RepID=UPI0015AE1FE6|nr:tRNA (guanosine(46)-N7)-methyltransferase TrmB [Zhenhengia yiwuensis]MBP3911814.1 tRNA (guanosine(46)-N7)-methyltransferase TrmB [Niameybacter sp.]MDU6359270.1 tRNA (guanosine(46)-N7)-methyltransferase TrmB [Clostridiales bacterium]MDY3366596.1 tRNA (guanosine(46)-N7)-methyltransferase TrmB [Zhenhengia yiwuensis]
MRLRRDPRATEYLAQDERVVQEPTAYKGKWHTLFGNDNPIHVEFGCGKGGFITELARRNPDINYVAAERAETVVYKACKKANREETPENLVFVFEDMAKCLDIFEAGEIDRLYLNFSDPWPKKRHAKKRLTYRDFLKKYAIILGEKGEIHFKTDNKGLFASSIEEFSLEGWLMKNVTLDLHNSDMEDNIMTEYEKKFSEMGFTINRLEAVPPKK